VIEVTVKSNSVICYNFVQDVSCAQQKQGHQQRNAVDRFGHHTPGIICPVSA
jgi:hypothetical protein